MVKPDATWSLQGCLSWSWRFSQVIDICLEQFKFQTCLMVDHRGAKYVEHVESMQKICWVSAWVIFSFPPWWLIPLAPRLSRFCPFELLSMACLHRNTANMLCLLVYFEHLDGKMRSQVSSSCRHHDHTCVTVASTKKLCQNCPQNQRQQHACPTYPSLQSGFI